MEFVRSDILGTKFETTIRYANVRPVGLGAFGLVCSAYDQITQQPVAIKKMMSPFASSSIAKRTYREVKLLKKLRHENLIGLCDIFISPLEDIYLVTELLGTDLGRLLRSKPLDNKFAQFFMYQLMRGLKYIHSAGVIHRDLKPSNLLINENCDLKICDFGLARVQEPRMTGYVSTRYYRAPEIMLTWQRYGVEVDIWSAGCILAEMLRGAPLFPGKDHINQFYLITDMIGNPPEEVIEKITSKNTRHIVESLPHKEPRQLRNLFTEGEADAVDLLERMLLFDQSKRISAADSLQHPYLLPYHDPADEPVAEEKFDWSFNDADLPKETWKLMMYSEVLDFHSTDANPSDSMVQEDFSNVLEFLDQNQFADMS
ncbi:mitogen-activated protein kinase mpkC [Aspergillus ambiguus]|uniref:mitogen-activated protein kinase mpkC n=1 Tax=Aspergillus ambiguus TaxID=176160 RepID=UPI003CCE2B5B